MSTPINPIEVAVEGIGYDELSLVTTGYLNLGNLTGTSIRNKIITRGLGPSRGLAGRCGPIIQGYGGLPGAVVEAIKQAIVRRRYGGSSSKRRHDQPQFIVVWSKMIEINDRVPEKKIEGSITINVKTFEVHAKVGAEMMSTIPKSSSDEFKVIVKRIK